ncbi:BnaA08g05790D [Brassica napus]|uniref:BnaA08g05790D protein n=1 Tax=Brassica napus TaxID=3708 RepID=A0A078GBM5_BRANA|nr:BnaA08g05790D [Brassica napus]
MTCPIKVTEEGRSFPLDRSTRLSKPGTSNTRSACRIFPSVSNHHDQTDP